MKIQLLIIIILNNDTEKNEVLEKYQTTVNKLPKIYTTDPMAKYYDMKKGDLIKVIRNDPEVGLSIAYKLVV